jgi:hypothetical protein
MPQPIFHIIPKDVQGPHIPKQVKETSMKEHERDEGKGLLPEGEMGGDFRHRIPDRNKAVHYNESIQTGTLGLLYQKERHVETDNDVIDNRVILGLNGIAKGNHGNLLPSRMAFCQRVKVYPD